MIPKISI